MASAASAAAPAVNPVGDVHERIRKMLTEGQPAPEMRPQGQSEPVRPARPMRPAAQPKQPPINPFRSAQALGKHSLEAAVDMFKSLGGTEDRRDIAPPRAPETPKPAARGQGPRGDLFDEQEDADLEIPSFLRKKKTG
jgi:cell division protein FtsZ